MRLAVSLLAYNLGNLWRSTSAAPTNRQLVADESSARLVKTGGRVVAHARYYWVLLAEGHLNRRRFGAMLGRMTPLPVPKG